MEHALLTLSSAPLLLFFLIVFPFPAALCVYQARSLSVQSCVAAAVSILLAACGLLLVPHAPFTFRLASVFGINPHAAVNGADFFLLCVLLYVGFRHHHPVIKALSAAQIILLAIVEFFIRHGKYPGDTFYGDNLALMLILVASTATALSVIRLCFIPSLKPLEDHPNLSPASRNRFFALMLICLGAFNGMLLANDMSFFYFFFELITLCSFLLIAQRGTPAAEKKAVQALSITSLVGLVFLLAMT